jgi:two-component system NtrC family sensor kinase
MKDEAASIMSDIDNIPDREPGNDFPYFRRTWNTVVVALLAAAFVPLIIIGGGMYFYMSTLLKQKTIESLRVEALELKNTVDQFLAERTQDLKLIAGNIGPAGLRNSDNLQTVFHSLQQQLPCFTDLGVIDERGRHLAYVGPYDLISKNYRDAQWFKTVMERGVYISDVFLGHRNVPHFVIAVKQDGDEGAWFLRATIDTDYFDRMIAEIAAKSKAQAYLVNRRGIYQSRPPAGADLMGPSPLTDLKAFEGVAFQEGSDSLLMTVWLEKVPWLCVVQMDRKAAFADLGRIRTIGSWVFILAAILMVMTVLLTTNHLVAGLELKRRSIHFLDRQLRQSNRLASAMELSFGFFREIKDTLTNIDAAAACIQDPVQPDHPAGIAESLAQIRSETARSRASIDKFTRFTRPTEPMIQELNVNDVLDDLMEFLDKELRFSKIGVIRNYSDSIPAIRSDPSELRQVFQNMILNAINAIGNNGEITLTTRRRADDVIVTVADTGPGIAVEHLEKIFEPLFTTQPGGTGLGLPICADILERLGGRIRVHNSPAGGACFVVTLPIRFSRPQETG